MIDAISSSLLNRLSVSLVASADTGSPQVVQYVKNGDMQSSAGWDNQIPASGVLIVGPADQAINTLAVALTNGVEYTLKYTATIASGVPSGTIRVYFGLGNQIIANPIVADGTEQTAVFTATANRTTARIIETSGLARSALRCSVSQACIKDTSNGTV